MSSDTPDPNMKTSAFQTLSCRNILSEFCICTLVPYDIFYCTRGAPEQRYKTVRTKVLTFQRNPSGLHHTPGQIMHEHRGLSADKGPLLITYINHKPLCLPYILVNPANKSDQSSPCLLSHTQYSQIFVADQSSSQKVTKCFFKILLVNS